MLVCLIYICNVYLGLATCFEKSKKLERKKLAGKINPGKLAGKISPGMIPGHIHWRVGRQVGRQGGQQGHFSSFPWTLLLFY